MDDLAGFEVRDTTHGGKPVLELCGVEREGRFVRLRMSPESMVLLHMATAQAAAEEISRRTGVSAGLTYTLQ